MKLLNKISRGALLVGLCSTVFAWASYSLYVELTGRINKSAGDAIGTITFKKKAAERKYSEFVIWEDIPQSSPVFNYDSIRTFNGSAASIILKSGASIDLDENTMIVLVYESGGLKVNFDKGSISARSGTGGGAVSVNTKDSSVTMTGGEASVSADSGRMNVSVSKGEAVIESGGETKKVGLNQAAVVENGKSEIKKIAVIPELPENNSYFISFGAKETVRFKWNTGGPARAKIEIAADRSFKDIIYSDQTEGAAASASLAAGDYYWRVSTGTGSSPVRKFSIMRGTYPAMISPSDNEYMITTGEQSPVLFKWKPAEFAVSYELVIAKDSGMNKPVKTMNVSSNMISVDGLSGGDYYWSVKAVYPERFNAAKTAQKNFFFNMEKKSFTAIKPRFIFDGDAVEASIHSKVIPLNWEGVRGAKEYLVEASASPDFKKQIYSERSANTFIKMDKIPPEGKYYLRVTAVSERGEKSVSPDAALTLTAPGPATAVYPPDGREFTDAPEKIKFSWRDPNGRSLYEYELARDEKFSAILKKSRTEEDSYLTAPPPPGKYFWRVNIVGPDGKLLIAGKTSSFSIPAPLEKPQALAPSNGRVIDIDTADSIRFQWKKVAEADYYEVEIFHRAGGNERSLIVMRAEKESVELKNFKVLEPGSISWVIRAKKRGSGSASAFSESEKNSFIIRVNENLPAPDPATKDTIYVR